MRDDVKVELSNEFLARIAMAARDNGPAQSVEPINLDFDRNSAVTAEGEATHAFLYAASGTSADR